MNQNLLDQLWRKAQEKMLSSTESTEPDDFHEVRIGSCNDGYDYMILRIFIEGYPEWHYRRKGPDGLWQSVSDCCDITNDEALHITYPIHSRETYEK